MHLHNFPNFLHLHIAKMAIYIIPLAYDIDDYISSIQAQFLLALLVSVQLIRPCFGENAFVEILRKMPLRNRSKTIMITKIELEGWLM